jgi:hypothetical protein
MPFANIYMPVYHWGHGQEFTLKSNPAKSLFQLLLYNKYYVTLGIL